MLGVGVLLFVVCFLGEGGLELLSLVVEAISKLLSELGELVVEASVVLLDLSVEGLLGSDLGLGESVTERLAGLIESSPFSFTEGLECLGLGLEGIREALSGLGEGLSDGGSLGLEGLDEVDL